MSLTQPEGLSPDRLLRLIRDYRAVLESVNAPHGELTDIERPTLANEMNALVQRYIHTVLIPNFLRSEVYASHGPINAKKLRGMMVETDSLIVVGDTSGRPLAPQEIGAADVARNALGELLDRHPNGEVIREGIDELPLAMAARERGRSVPRPPPQQIKAVQPAQVKPSIDAVPEPKPDPGPTPVPERMPFPEPPPPMPLSQPAVQAVQANGDAFMFGPATALPNKPSAPGEEPLDLGPFAEDPSKPSP